MDDREIHAGDVVNLDHPVRGGRPWTVVHANNEHGTYTIERRDKVGGMVRAFRRVVKRRQIQLLPPVGERE